MDQQAASLLATLKRPAAPSEAKLNALNALKSDIKHYRVPENAQATIFECIKLAVTQQASSSLASAAFSTLGHLLKRLKIQDPAGTAITHLSPRLYAAITERLGDIREPIRTSAGIALGEMWQFLGQDVEKIIRDDAIGGPHVRARETGMQWVVRMHKEENMPFKSYVAPIVACVEDADGGVREAAKNALVELFREAPDRAKSDLKKQMKAHSVRHAIESQILSQIGAESAPKPQAAPESEPEKTSSLTRSLPTLDHAAHFAESINSEAARPPPQETVQMDPIYTHSERDLNDIFRDMLPCFEGKETEQNWMPRDKSVLKLRKLLKGNAPSEYHHAFMVGLKSVMEGILKVASSLRTTMSSNGCQLIRELAKTLGPALDSQVEILLQTFIKMSSATKHIAAENGKTTVDMIFQHCSYNARLMQHVWSAAQDKNASVRQCTPDWLRTLLRRQAGYRSHFESSGGLELAEKCIRKGLEDANPKVKEAMRATYWTFAKTWPEKAQAIMDKLDPKSRGMLEKDSNNPNAAIFAGSQPSIGPSVKSTSSTARSALKELMAEQRRAKSAARSLPERPNSAMTLLSPVKQRAEMSSSNRPQSKLKTDTRVTSNASTSSSNATSTKGNSLMSGPVRRPRRPEIQRPQTADPYAARRLLRPETPAIESPTTSPPRGTSASKTSIPTSSSSRSRAKTATAVASREGSPVVFKRAMPSAMNRLASSSRPTSKDSTNGSHTGDFSAIHEDEVTSGVPTFNRTVASSRRVPMPSASRPTLDKTMSVDSGMPVMEEGDGFTMAMSLAHSRNNSQTLSQRSRSPELHRSPVKAMIEAARERLDRPTSSSSNKTLEIVQPDDPFLENGLHALPPRRASPVKSIASPNAPEVQIYEDPTPETANERPLSRERQVLSELPVNENVRVQSPTQSVGSSTSPTNSPRQTADARSPAPHSVVASPQDRAEVLRNRRLLASGIERVRARTLDAHGFRRVQDVAKSTSDIWEGGKKFDELMAAVLDYLLAFEQDPKLTQLPATKSAGLKAQALSVVRALLTVHSKPARAWYDRALVVVLTSRKQVDGGNTHVVADLERTMDEIIRIAPGEVCINAVVDHLASSPLSTCDESSAGTAMALTYLRTLVKVAHNNGNNLKQDHKVALARTASKFLEDADAEVRKADVELACEVFGLFDEDVAGADGNAQTKAEFWREFKGVEEGRLGLLTYYIARSAKSRQ